MRLQHQILENLNSNNKQVIDDQFGTIEKELFKLKELVSNEEVLIFIQNTILELNNFRMDYWNDRITESSDFETYTDYSQEHPVEKQRHTQEYCNTAALQYVLDNLPSELGADWQRKSLIDIEDVVHDLVYRYNEANIEPEYGDCDFYGDEADPIEIYNVILDKYNLRKDLRTKDMNESDNYEELDDVSMYKNFNHVNDVWNFLESSTSEEDLKDKISQINPREFGTIYYDLHEDKNGATVIIDFQSDDEDYYEKVDVYFNEN